VIAAAGEFQGPGPSLNSAPERKRGAHDKNQTSWRHWAGWRAKGGWDSRFACVTLVFTASKESKMTSYYPDPNLLDDVSIDQVRLLPNIKRALVAAGLKTVGDVRETSDAMLLSFQNLGQSSVTRLRNELGRRDRA
jgi:Bacterial RNA polymerase, alpha chain C terminal domain